MIIITCEQLGCAYSIDAEGTLFYSPLMVGGGLETQDWTEVDHLAMLGEEKQIQDTINEVHQQLSLQTRHWDGIILMYRLQSNDGLLPIQTTSSCSTV